jgi:hypothetical protein
MWKSQSLFYAEASSIYYIIRRALETLIGTKIRRVRGSTAQCNGGFMQWINTAWGLSFYGS